MTENEPARLVGKRVRERRHELGLTQEQAAALAGEHVSSATWRVVEKGSQPTLREATKHGVCRALRWSTDSIDRILRGEEPIEIPDDVPPGVSYRQVERFGPPPDDVEAIENRLHELISELGRRARGAQQ